MEFLDNKSYRQTIPDLASLFQRSFKKEIPEPFLEWRYLQNPCGDILACEEYDESRLIANYSASPCVIARAGQTYKTALSMTTMTDPDYGGRGLFTKPAAQLYEEKTRRDYAMIWGFPNSLSHRGFISRLQWVDIYEIPTMVLDCANAGLRYEESVKLEFDNSFDLDYPDLTAGSELVSVKKDRNYLKWRYDANPMNEYQVLVIKRENQASSYCVIKNYMNDNLDLIDFQAKDGEEGDQLLSVLLKYADEQKIKKINAWAPRHHFIHPLLEKRRFSIREPITYLGARVLNETTPSLDIGNFSGWYLQMGDSDVY